MWDMHGELQRCCLAKLWPFNVPKLLPGLVVSIAFQPPNFVPSELQSFCCTFFLSSVNNKSSLSGNLVFRSARSRSCPFCRNCLNRLSTRDLWVLTSDTDVIDSETVAKENLLHFYLYIGNLPLFQPDMNIFIPDYML